jgi:hypothetical protein
MAAGISTVKQFAVWRVCTADALVLFVLAAPVSFIQKVVHRLSS